MRIKVEFENPVSPGTVIMRSAESPMAYLVDNEGFLTPLPEKKKYKIDSEDFQPGTTFIRVAHALLPGENFIIDELLPIIIK